MTVETPRVRRDPERPVPTRISLRRDLLRWYDRQARPLPWRSSRDPYAIWISEIMLQQTTVAAVLPYYERFLQRFPDVESLAAAEEEEVLQLWSGLGYYRRARQLHAAARVIREQGAGFPSELEAIRALPGIGEYTAGAIGSIAFGLPVAAIDGNVSRVISRLERIDGAPNRAATKRRIRDSAASLVDPQRPGDFNQAVMDLGATVCTPRSPECPRCPIRTHCAAHEVGDPERFPERVARRAMVSVLRAAVLIEERGRVLFERVAPGQPNEGLWQLPTLTLAEGEDAPSRIGSTQRARLVESWKTLGLSIELGPRLAKVRHGITHHRIDVHLFHAKRTSSPTETNWSWWTRDEADTQALTAACRKLLAETRSD